MRLLLVAVMLLAGCGSTLLAPGLVREPRPEPVQLSIGAHYSEELRSHAGIPTTLAWAPNVRGAANVRLGKASVKLLDDALGLLFARVVAVPALGPATAADGRPAAVIAPRIVDATLELTPPGYDGPFGLFTARTTLVYGFTLYSATGESVAAWTVTGAGLL